MSGYITPNFFFLNFKISFSRIFSKPRKNTFELVGTNLNELLFIYLL